MTCSFIYGNGNYYEVSPFRVYRTRIYYQLTESAYETSEPGYESSGNVISEKSVCVSLKFVPYLRIVCFWNHISIIV